MLFQTQTSSLFQQAYDRQQWKQFLADTFPNVALLSEPIPISIDTYFAQQAFLLGNITLHENGFERTLAVYEVELATHIQIERNRVGLRNLLRKYWKNIDGAFIVFYQSQKPKWRFMYVSELTGFDAEGNFQTIQTEPKRYTYLLGKGENVRTATERFNLLALKGNKISLNDIKEAFSVEKVTKEFYTEVARWYERALQLVQFPEDAEKHEKGRNIALIRLLTRLFFIWFMKEKGLIPSILFDATQLAKMLKNFRPNDEQNGNYYKAILQNLFFATLNTPIEQRKFRREHSFQGKNNDYMNHSYYRYHYLFENAEESLQLFQSIPFLNGGLFECLDFRKDDPHNHTNQEIRIDGYSDIATKQAFVPNVLFFGAEGIVSIFQKYHFTIEENTPFDQQVSLDPELLGKVFENLLATYNPETCETARKATGSFYTPREIVYFMVKASLIEFFKNQLSEKIANLETLLEQLFSHNDSANPFNKEDTKLLIKALHDVKIIDPAVGSGAFLMEALNQMTHLLSKLDPKNELWKNQQIQAIEQFIADPLLKQKTIHHIESVFQHNELGYGRKLFLIQNCLYGVDIQPIAIHIAKLRFFLSLLVDEKIDNHLPNQGIEPLPNLETKLIAANTLISLPRYEGLQTDAILEAEKQLFQLRKRYFETTDQAEKEKLKNQDQQLRSQIQQALKNGGFASEFADAIARADIYDTQKSQQWFDAEWMFGIKEGFDILIGNPPYIQLQKDAGKLAKMFEKQNYETFTRTGDIYALFYEKGIHLLKNNGILCYITSNKWMRAGYGEKLRKFFIQYSPILLIDLGPGVFESATVDTNILLIQKQKTTNIQLQALTLQKQPNVSIEEQLRKNGSILQKLTQDAWFIGSSAEQKLKEKIERIGKPLKDWDVNIYRGVLTGLNKAFIITTEKRNEILANCQDEAERTRTQAIIKPILRGRDIKRYYYEWADLWVINTHNGVKEKNIPRIDVVKDYPAIYKHLLQYEKELIKRQDQGDHWTNLRNCAYIQEFEKEKVVYSETIKIYFDGTKNYPRFSYVSSEIFLDKTTFFFSGKNQKYILGLLNSKIAEYLLENGYSVKLGIGSRGLQKILIEKIPIPPVTTSNEGIVRQIEGLVEKILSAKQQNPQADTRACEREIDRLVYQLYELTEQEIKIIDPAYV
ncbi:Eco57I restriction-modification methylase domain-containing protein [Raineya orbicola]|uniref:site-specific DNA-methyltransferase (adenine-specific) n=1 Tax=Raineya orbicola TaxID=2016530 RepID=A0A2N3IDG2_9BACT|nr:N-6 DNA methylase [Raineya orbicola]PKQ68347.1 Eco57I restriction-modification methylase [Raineya orbicola]